MTINSLSAATAKALRAFGRVTTDLVLPPQCLCCSGRTGATGTLCPACWSGIDFITEPLCPRTGRPFGHHPGEGVLSIEALEGRISYDRARYVARYGDGIAGLIHALKYKDRLEVARPLGHLMARAGAGLLAQAHVLVPVPLYRVRLWRRRYNQAALLAQRIGEAARVPVRTDLLVRARPTRPQVGLSAGQRRRNVAGAFAVPDARVAEVAGRRIVLVDDVITTGATIEACVKCLRRASAESVDVLAAARVIDAT